MRHFLILALLAPGSVWALNKGPKPPAAELPKPFPPVTCENAIQQLKELKVYSSKYDQAVASFMDAVFVTMETWHRDLVNWEGTSVKVAKGTFLPMKLATEDLSKTQELVWDSSARADSRFDEILEVLPSCLKAAK